MPSSLAKILLQAIGLARSTPLLWALVLIASILPSYRGRYATWLTCFLSMAMMPVAALAGLAIPHVVHRAASHLPSTFSSTWQAIKGLWPRLLGLYVVLAIPGFCYLLAWFALAVERPPQTPAPWAVIVFKYAFGPWIGATVYFALAGIAIHNLDGLRAFINSILITSNNLVAVATLGVTLALLTIIPQATLLLVQGGPSAAGRVITSWLAFSAAGQTFLEYTVWSLFQAAAYLPVSVLRAATWSLLYLQATEKIAYPGLARETAA